MKKFDGILICTDLDGTIYRSDKTISKENREAIEYFKSEGGYFTFITGRMPCYSVDAYRGIQPNVPFGCINGGGVYDGEANKYVWVQGIGDGVMDLVQYVDETFPDVGIQVCVPDRVYFAKDNETLVRFRKLTGVPKNFCPYRQVKEQVVKILFGCDHEDMILAMEKELRSHPLADGFDFIRSEKTLFEILPKGVNKGLALSKIVEHLKIDPQKTVAIGDYNNDIGMFKVAKLGIAVSNASDAAKAAADIITVSNEEHAIAKVIYSLESGEYTL